MLLRSTIRTSCFRRPAALTSLPSLYSHTLFPVCTSWRSMARSSGEDDEDVEREPAEYDISTEEEVDDEDRVFTDLTPKEVVEQLNKHIIGQEAAKKAVAVALRNRWRRHRLSRDMSQEVTPKNILMVGPTGCGKTEVARRVSKLTNSPFIKVEATKFTEVGYHGRDVDSIIRDLVRVAITEAKTQQKRKLKSEIKQHVEDLILDALVGSSHNEATRDSFRKHLREGRVEDQKIEIEVMPKEPDLPDVKNAGVMMINIGARQMKNPQKKTMTVAEARPILEEAEIERLVSNEDVTKKAIKMVENDGIVFIDEIDKICRPAGVRYSSVGASDEGVQKDLLPLIEGTDINTKYGNVNTSHILFVASGAFHSCKPSDLLAELQGRLPIRVELKGLVEQDLFQILTNTKFNLVEQQRQLMQTEGVDLQFADGTVEEIAKVAHEINTNVQNIGARRLQTIMERVMEDLSFDASELGEGAVYVVTPEMVRSKVKEFTAKSDLSRYIL